MTGPPALAGSHPDYEAMFRIGALCPWCLLVTLSTTLVFASLTSFNIRNNLYLPPRAHTTLLTGAALVA